MRQFWLALLCGLFLGCPTDPLDDAHVIIKSHEELTSDSVLLVSFTVVNIGQKPAKNVMVAVKGIRGDVVVAYGSVCIECGRELFPHIRITEDVELPKADYDAIKLTAVWDNG